MDLDPIALFSFFGVFSYALLLKFSSYAFDLHHVWQQFTCPNTVEELRQCGRHALIGFLVLTILSLTTMFAVLHHEMHFMVWAFSHIPAGVFFLYWCGENEPKVLLERWGVDDKHVEYNQD